MIRVCSTLAVAKAFAMAPVSAESLLQNKKLDMARSVSAIVIAADQRKPKTQERKQKPSEEIDPGDANKTPEMPTLNANDANLMGICQRQTAANGAQNCTN